MNLFVTIVIVQLFYSFAITSVSYAMPEDSLNFVSAFSDIANDINLENVSVQVQDSIESQTNIPIIELGALVFYSGNILIDLMLNFAFAIPEMIGLLTNAFLMLLNVNSYIWALVQLFASVVVTVMYFIGLMNILIGVRSGRMV